MVIAIIYGLLAGKNEEDKIGKMESAEKIMKKVVNTTIFSLLTFFFFAAILDGFGITVTGFVKSIFKLTL